MRYVLFNPKPPDKDSNGAEKILDLICRNLEGEVTWICCENFDFSDKKDYSNLPYKVVKVRNYFSLILKAFRMSVKDKETTFISLCDDIQIVPLPILSKNTIGICFHFKGRTMLTELNYRLNHLVAWSIFAISMLSWSSLGRMIWRRKKVLTISEFSKNQILQRRLTKNIRICQENIGVPQSSLKFLKEGSPTITTVSRLVKYKGVQDILEAVSLLKRRNLKVNLQIIGDGPYMPYLQKQTRELGLSDRVQFKGFLHDGLKSELVGKSWLHIMSSYREGWPRTPGEALLLDTPSLLSKASLGQEIESMQPYIYETPLQLSMKIESMIMNPKEIPRAIEIEREVLGKYNEEGMIKQFVNEICSIQKNS